ncbi:MAG: hypothetical protein RL088_914 [Verrucomicrobiota bacterium]|jgi:hypothetical protein
MRSLLFLLAASSALALEIRVSPDGPVNSLVAARDAVRAAREKGDASAVRVIVGEGTYAITEPVVFEPRDGGVTYEAAPGAKPVFTGGRRIDGWKKDGALWTTKTDLRFDALWINGQRAVRARTPNKGFIQAMGQPTEPVIAKTGEAGHTLLAVAPEFAAPLAALKGDEANDVNVLVYFNWDMNRHRLAAAKADGTLQFTGPLRGPFFSLAPFHNMRLENYRAALDEKGEWFLARDGTLSYMGDEPKEAVAPVAPQWLIIRGDAKAEKLVRGLAFRGLAFRHQGWTLPKEGAFFGQAESKLISAIEADGARDVVFEDCEFGHTLTTAAWFRRGCSEITLRKCHIHDLGAGGVKIGDPAITQAGPEHTHHVLVENTIISGGGRHFPGGIGATIFHASDTTLRHCDIGDFFYSAVSIGWTWGYKPTACARNVVEHCKLHHLGWAEMSDLAAVYTLGPQPGTVIRDCWVHDIGCLSYGGWGLYNDEGSTGIVWENNLVHDTQDGGYHQHYGRGNIIRNNIFANQREVQVRRSKPEEFLAFSFEQNIVLFKEGRLFGHVDKNWFDGRMAVNRNLYWKTGGKPFDFAGKTWDDWRLWGHDAEGLIADPLFADVEKGDFTLRAGSPAEKIGFKPFDWRKAGVTGDAAWKALAARPLPPMVYGAKPKAPPLKLTDGFEGTAIGGKPTQASGGYKKGDIIRVVGEGAATGARCLQLTDGPDIDPAFDPHFYYHPGHDKGTTRVAFSVKLEPGFHLVHEWREDRADGGKAYQSGPMLNFEKGALSIPGRKLADIPANVWLRVEITARVGEDRDNTYTLTLTEAGKPAQRFEKLPFVTTTSARLDWLGFIGAGKAAAKAWIDDVEIANAE